MTHALSSMDRKFEEMLSLREIEILQYHYEQLGSVLFPARPTPDPTARELPD